MGRVNLREKIIFKNWYKLKRNFFYWFIYRVCKHPEGKLLPWYFILLKILLFPLEAYDYWRRFNKETGYDFFSDTLTINGVRYNRQMFYLFKKGKIFRVIEIKDGILTIEDFSGDLDETKSC